jgi:ribosomal protein L37AE/L43A
MKEVDWSEPIEKAEFVFKRMAMLMEHNYLCAVCKENSAVQNVSDGILQPCWDCQNKGYILCKRKSWIPSWVYE